MMTQKYIQVTLLITEEEGKFVALCKELGTATCGDTVDEALKNIKEAVTVHLNALEEAGLRKKYFKEHNIEMLARPVAPNRRVTMIPETIVKPTFIPVCV